MLSFSPSLVDPNTGLDMGVQLPFPVVWTMLWKLLWLKHTSSPSASEKKSGMNVIVTVDTVRSHTTVGAPVGASVGAVGAVGDMVGKSVG
jgi:hypothetical protein